MSVIPEEWGEADSRSGLLYELLWALLAIVVLGALAYWEPFAIDVTVTPRHLTGSAILGATLGIVVSYLSFGSDRFRAVWKQLKYRSAAIFLVAVGGQLGIMIIPTWTILTLLAVFLTVIPVRLYIYFRAR